MPTSVHSGEGTATVEFVGASWENASVCIVVYDRPKVAAITRAKETTHCF